MALVFEPRIDFGTDSPSYYILPTVQENEETGPKDFYRAKVPLRDGEITGGVSKDPVDISVRGIIHKDTWAEAEAELANLRAAVDGDGDGKFKFFEYFDATSGTYRYWKDCIGVLSVSKIYPAPVIPYVIRIRANDPEIYSSL